MVRVQRLEQRLRAGGREFGLLVSAVLIAGCTGGSPATPTPGDASLPAASASLAETPTASPSATQSAAATIAHDADLATLLPTTLGDAPLTVARFDGEDLSDLPRAQSSTRGYDPIGFAGGDFGGGMEGVARELDVSLADVQGAMAYAPDHEPVFSPHSVIAIRVVGADPAAMVDALAVGIGGVSFLAGEFVPTEETVGGKPVSVFHGSNSSYWTFFYTIGDVAFIVKTPDPDEAEDVLRQLP